MMLNPCVFPFLKSLKSNNNRDWFKENKPLHDASKKYDQEFPTKYFNDFLKYISIDESEFWSIIDKFRPNHLWSKTNGKWVLNHTVQD